MKKLITILFLFTISTLLVAQTAKVTPYGVSPRETTVDTLDIFDLAYNSLANVGVGTKMYLKATTSVALTGGQVWTCDKAEGTLGAKAAIDPSSEVTVFTPTVKGTYKVTFTDGVATATITINAALYLGIEGGALTCAGCHADKKAEWAETGHSDMLTRGVNGLISSYYSAGCISCHTTGFDENAVNNGFDDFTFVFPTVKGPGSSDSLKTKYPDAWKRANIQCESCHGPGDAHMSVKTDSKMVSSLDTKNCSLCHDSGTHHYYPEQWKNTGHANPPVYSSGTWSSSCTRCHTGQGFINYIEGKPAVGGATTPFSCAVCHDPHSVDNLHQVRTTKATLNNGMEVEGGTGGLCMNCHMSRRDAVTYAPTSSGSHFGPHYMPQADMLVGTNVVTWGFNLPTSPHFQAVDNTCAGCHMATPAEHEGIGHMGEHNFSVSDHNTGEENVEACAPCHGELTSFDEKKFFFNGMADHDEDGVAEGLQDEVHGLMDILAELLPHADTVAGYDAHDAVGSTWPRVQREAAYNFEMVYYDHSYGVHNPAFTVGLLKLSIAALKYEMTGPGMITGVRDVPNDQGNQVGVSWTKFGGDGGNAVLENPVKAYGVWRVEQIPGKAISNNKINSSNLKIGDQINDEGKLLTYVAYVPAAKLFEYNAMVPTLFNTVGPDTAWTEFVVSAFNENGNVQWTEPAAGFSVDNLIPGAPKAFAGELGDMKVNLTWEESEDVDFKYFAVYRSTTQGSVPSTPYATTTDLKFVDNSVLSGTTYYYVMSAFDFNGNQSDYTQELPFTITSLEEISGTPTQFSLSQNYPNPFNPTTMIKFGLPEASNVKVTVYDAVGKEVGVLVNEYLNSGYYNYSWNASNMATGVYFYEMKAGNFTQVHKMLLVK